MRLPAAAVFWRFQLCCLPAYRPFRPMLPTRSPFGPARPPAAALIAEGWMSRCACFYRSWLASLVGGIAGAVLLLRTPAHTFLRVLPWLMLAATLLFLSAGAGRQADVRSRA